MIVVDANVLAYLILPSDRNAVAERLLAADPAWLAPPLWRSGFRSVLAGYLRRGLLDMDAALAAADEAEERIAGRELGVTDEDVLALVAASRCSSYDCEYVALAKERRLKLVTSNRALLLAFPETAVSPEDFVRAHGATVP